MAYSWDNRVKFVVRYMYDIDNNGFLDKNDFECLAVRNTVIEGKGNWDEATFKKNQEIMANLWNEIADLADFNKDGEISTDEFTKAIDVAAKGKTFSGLPPAFKFFIENQFRTLDVDGEKSDLYFYLLLNKSLNRYLRSLKKTTLIFLLLTTFNQVDPFP